ncbi:MAG: response regulator [Arcobacter sp.]|jgi:DNA-binding response OmpR family regulator|uniref:response regulator transcription factor n=1 Tax=unclassified Arcobacter TaxID=2593671 RepID=UPI0002296382|nr:MULTISPECIES: response regulator [unclassified Arcobacter]MDY3201266.1 response regulator [Arcobacter sp.]BAK74132.1 two-component response regulator [Arcobacter sp. L]
MLKNINKNIKILYVEDDEIARENGIEYLENFFETIYEASDAIIALQLYEKYKPDIIITDIQMPKLNGLEFVKRIRQKDKKTQIIVITAFCDKEYLLKAIELQLVKYLVKPVKEKEFEEALFLCVNSLKDDVSNIVQIDNEIYFDTFNKNLVINNEIVKLRAKEILFLELLIKNKNRYVTYEEIENYVWADSVMTKDALKTLVKNIKTKIPKDLILNLTNSGYKINV